MELRTLHSRVNFLGFLLNTSRALTSLAMVFEKLTLEAIRYKPKETASSTVLILANCLLPLYCTYSAELVRVTALLRSDARPTWNTGDKYCTYVCGSGGISRIVQVIGPVAVRIYIIRLIL